MELLHRRWRITVGTFQTEELAVEFACKRTLRPAPGTAEVKLYNLSADHHALVQSARGQVVRIEAGYVDGMSQLFQGDVRRVDIERAGPDWITKITAGDGAHAIRTARGRRSFGPDTTIEEVVRYAAAQMGVGTGNVAEVVRAVGLDRLGAAFPARGTVLHGSAADELGELLRTAGLEWSVQGGVLQVLPRGGALQRQAIVLAPDTGLVGSPEAGQHGAVKAKALLIPELVPGRLVQLESVVREGLYRIEKASYKGESDGTDWYAELEMRHPA